MYQISVLIKTFTLQVDIPLVLQHASSSATDSTTSLLPETALIQPSTLPSCLNYEHSAHRMAMHRNGLISTLEALPLSTRLTLQTWETAGEFSSRIKSCGPMPPPRSLSSATWEWEDCRAWTLTWSLASLWWRWVTLVSKLVPREKFAGSALQLTEKSTKLHFIIIWYK